jgi:hypothetical protein
MTDTPAVRRLPTGSAITRTFTSHAWPGPALYCLPVIVALYVTCGVVQRLPVVSQPMTRSEPIMTATAELDIFSGRDNPTRQLTASEEAALAEKIRTLSTPATAVEAQPLGYRSARADGFSVAPTDPGGGSVQAVAALCRVVELTNSSGATTHWADTTGIEKFLLDFFRSPNVPAFDSAIADAYPLACGTTPP